MSPTSKPTEQADQTSEVLNSLVTRLTENMKRDIYSDPLLEEARKDAIHGCINLIQLENLFL